MDRDRIGFVHRECVRDAAVRGKHQTDTVQLDRTVADSFQTPEQISRQREAETHFQIQLHPKNSDIMMVEQFR